MDQIEDLLKKAHSSSKVLQQASNGLIKKMLTAMAALIEEETEAIIKENKKDVKEVKESLELVIQTNEHTLEVKDEDVNITEASDENDDGMMIGAKRKLENEGEANAGVKKLKGSGCSNGKHI